MAEIIKIDIDQRQVAGWLAAMVARARNLSPAMRTIAGYLAASVEDNFAAQGRPPWTPLAPSTIKARKAKGYWPGKILQRRGELAASVQQGHSDTAAWAGSNKKYAAVHQFGDTITIPARTVQVHLRKVSRGKHKGRSLFASRRQRGQGNVTTRSKSIPAYQVTIPARPFLRVTRQDTERIAEAMKRHLQGG